ncbi:MAG TPA: M48 family metalloprotease [Candidatus Eisenbacteria bacterium]|nr:M48 family metalloprotease [Candidatus Eisenbacteria bacterium]
MPRNPAALQRKFIPVAAALFICLWAPFLADAQQACPPVRIPSPDPRSNMFSDRQEMDVGDAIAEHVQREFLVIDDPDYTAYVHRIGQKLLDHAPPTELSIQFFLSDLPVANALSLPGGRVYVSRKLVAMARNEDELAGVLGHELGHVLTHQPVIKVSQLFRQVLGVTQPGSREEIFKHYADLQDSLVRKRKAFDRGGEEKQEQLIADQIGMQLVANSGYRVQAFGDIFDRISETKGKTGSWLSDLFGSTSSESKRLREIFKQAPALACAAPASSPSPEEFQKWRGSVVSYSGLGHQEQLQDVINRITLNPPLQSDLRRIRFSPDGRFLLAQNESTIFVLDAASFSSKFSIYAPGAYEASFTPDSQSVVFYNPALRVETWSVADETRVSANETVVTSGCVQSRLSPDGRFLACLNREYDLALYDTESNAQVFIKKHFYEPSMSDYFFLLLARILEEGNLELLHMRFSPDARFFVAHSSREESLAVSLGNFQQVALPGSLRKLLSRDFDFIGADKVVGVDPYDRKSSGVVKFPGGEPVLQVPLGAQSVESASNARYLLLRPIAGHPLGVMDLQSSQILIASEHTAGDVAGDSYVFERTDGDLGIINVDKRKMEPRHLKLPLGQLGELRAVGVSPDLRWLAISGKSRGAEWDLLHNQRVFYVRGFEGALVGPDGVADVDIQKFEKTERRMVRMDPATKTVTPGMDLEKAQGSQIGGIFLRTTHNGKENWKRRDMLFEALDARTGTVLWSRNFPKEAPTTVSRRKESLLVFSWPANSEGAKQEIRSNPALSQRWPKIEADSNDHFLEALEPRTGKILGATIVRTGKGSFAISSAEAAGNFLVAADSANRLHVISLETGEQKGLLFGGRPALSGESGLVSAENERGELSLYDLGTMSRRRQYVFTKPIIYVAFGADRRRMLVLTGDQNVYYINLPTAAAATPGSAAELH